jgi:hypothetical protein
MRASRRTADAHDAHRTAPLIAHTHYAVAAEAVLDSYFQVGGSCLTRL